MTGLFALLIAAMFTGAAAYITFVEQPARAGLDDAAMLAQWKPAYHRGFIMQASLAVLGSLCGLGAWWTTGQWAWLAGSIALFANWPYTLIAIMPVNRALMMIPPGKAGAGSRRLLTHWAKLHAGRTVLGAVSVCLFLVASAI